MAALEDRQLKLIGRMAALDPPECFMGGCAEDAVLAGEATRPHVDLDWLLPRSELDERLAQAAQFGFQSFETWGESAPGQPFNLYGESGELELDLGVADEERRAACAARPQAVLRRRRPRAGRRLPASAAGRHFRPSAGAVARSQHPHCVACCPLPAARRAALLWPLVILGFDVRISR